MNSWGIGIRNDMKVLMINSVCGIGSTGRICTDIAEQFASEGHEVKIAYGREAVLEKHQKYAVRIGSELEVRKNALSCRILDNDGFQAKRATKKFLKWAEAYDPDLLWLHNLHGYYINIELLFHWIKSRPNMKVKWTLHDCWAFTGHCAYFTAAQCFRWETQCYDCIQKKKYPSSYIKDNCRVNFARKKAAFTGVDGMRLITPSKWLADLVDKSFLKEYPVEVHYNTIDTSIFRPTFGNFRERYGLENKKIVLGVASAWGERKGLSDFIKLSEMLDEQYVIVLVGLTDKQLRQIPKQIIAIRRTNSTRELAEIYTAADVFLNLTYEDNYPTTNLEAQCCKTPCITYRTGGSVESVPPENIVEQGDLVSVVELIRKGNLPVISFKEKNNGR